MNILYGDISKITNFHYKRVNTCLEKALLCLLSNDIPPFIDDYRSLARTEGFNTFCREIRELRNGAAGLSNQRLKEEFAAYQLNHLYKELPLLVRIAEATNICSVIQEAAASAISNIVSPERYLASPNQITGDLSRFISTALNIDQIINLRPALTLNNVESAVRVVDLSYISAVRIGGAIRIANEMYKSWAEEPNSSWVERYTEACVAAIHGDYLDAARKFGKAAMLADNADQEMYSYSFQAQYCIEANQPQTAITINKKIISQKSKLKTLSKFTLLVFNPYYAIANIYYSSFNEIYQELSQKTLDENKQNELKLLQVNLSRLVQFYANLALDEISDLDRYFKAKGRSRTLLTMTGNEISPRRQEQAAVQLPGVNHQQQPATLQEQAAVQLPGANRQQQPATLQEQAAVQLPGVNHQQQPATLQEQAAVQLPGA
ncbi:MAG: hypothetical protein P1U36_00940, partial [Legionellaceae bacterium]|nr:hypothetical protein [Legionellaceae bacterium]